MPLIHEIEDENELEIRRLNRREFTKTVKESGPIRFDAQNEDHKERMKKVFSRLGILWSAKDFIEECRGEGILISVKTDKVNHRDKK